MVKHKLMELAEEYEKLHRENAELKMALTSVLKRMYVIDSTDGLDPVSLTVVQSAAMTLEKTECDSTKNRTEVQMNTVTHPISNAPVHPCAVTSTGGSVVVNSDGNIKEER